MMHEYGFKKSDFRKDEKGRYPWVISKDWREILAVGSATKKQRISKRYLKQDKLLSQQWDPPQSKQILLLEKLKEKAKISQ